MDELTDQNEASYNSNATHLVVSNADFHSTELKAMGSKTLRVSTVASPAETAIQQVQASFVVMVIPNTRDMDMAAVTT